MPKILEIVNKLHIIVLLLLTCSGSHFPVGIVNHIVRSSLLIWSFQRIYIFVENSYTTNLCILLLCNINFLILWAICFVALKIIFQS